MNSVNNSVAVYVMTHGPECKWTGSYCFPIEIGAACHEIHSSYIRDDDGDNISKKDILYCELTGLYWMWKNDSAHDFLGLYHYRRIFKLSRSKIISYLRDYEWIVPKVTRVNPNISEHYIREHIPEDWRHLMETLKDLYPEYYNTAQSLFGKDEVYFTNMFISSREMVSDYCNWLFPILQAVEVKLNLNDGRSKYQQRAIGFMAERLFYLYIKHNNFNVKEVRIWYVPPYAHLSPKIPKWVSKVVSSNIYIYNLTLMIQDFIVKYIVK